MATCPLVICRRFDVERDDEVDDRRHEAVGSAFVQALTLRRGG
jgi:hypothetical protein